MAGTNNGNGEDKPMVDPQKQYLIEQFGNLMEKVGEGYGGPLQEELIRRMEQTIADFDEEVSEMLEHLRDNSVKRHEKLKEISKTPNVKKEHILTSLSMDSNDKNLVGNRRPFSNGEVFSLFLLIFILLLVKN